MQIKYINQNLQYQRNTTPMGETPTMVDYVITDTEVTNVAVLFDKDGDTFLALVSDSKENPNQKVKQLNIEKYIQTKSGAFKLDKVIEYTLSNTGRFIQVSLDENFSSFEPNPYDQNGALKPNLVTEYDFFLNILGKGIYTGAKMTIFEAYSNLLKRIFA